MNHTLRKRHLLVWAILGALLPLGFLTALIWVPRQPLSGTIRHSPRAGLSVVLRSVSSANFTVRLRMSRDHESLQTEWDCRKPLAFASALIYQCREADAGIRDSTILGRIGSQGTYYFDLNEKFPEKKFQFLVYDIIHHQVIERISL
jgi:hypothetical protein